MLERDIVDKLSCTVYDHVENSILVEDPRIQLHKRVTFQTYLATCYETGSNPIYRLPICHLTGLPFLESSFNP